MNLDEKLQQLKKAASKSTRDLELERQLAYVRQMEDRARRVVPLPAERATKGIEEYVDGRVEGNTRGEFFLARQTLPFGRPYGKLRVGDVTAANLSSLDLFLDNIALPKPSELVYLDTETTGLAGGTGTCAFLIGIAAADCSEFVIRQFFLRDYPDEKAALTALAEALEPYQGLVTFNGKTFDIPLLETRYALARIKSPFARLLHLDLLHPARRLWKLRLESCKLTDLEKQVLRISRDGDVPGSEIPAIYFDYLRTGDARGLQPVFFHNALDLLSLAALTVEVAQTIRDGGATAPSLDLYSLSRIFARAGATEQSTSTCHRALTAGLPPPIENRALWHLASQHKRRREHELAVEIWLELTRRETPVAVEAFEELAIYYEHRRRDATTALTFTESALERLRENVAGDLSRQASRRGDHPAPTLERFTHRLERLRRKAARTTSGLR